MRRLTISFSILILTFIWIYHTAATEYNPPINTVIGDISYVLKFGSSPTADTDKNIRIEAHLEYAEKLLRDTKEVVFTGEERRKRLIVLNFLHQYLTEDDYSRVGSQTNDEVFYLRDEQAKPSALGFLIEKTAGKQTVDQIINEIKPSNDNKHSLTLMQWLAENGLTKEEAAIIQHH